MATNISSLRSVSCSGVSNRSSMSAALVALVLLSLALWWSLLRPPVLVLVLVLVL